jgi:predicted ATPase
MLTRVEIDGFKTFEHFTLDLQPFTVIFGANGTGKSNFFDALRLLSRLASMDIATAFAGADAGREANGSRGDPIEQFRQVSGNRSPRITLAVEVLLPLRVRDSQGGEADLAQTRLRYEITIERREDQGRQRLMVTHEAATPIRKDEDHWEPGGREPSRSFQDLFVRRRRKTALISTQTENGNTILNLHQEGRQGRKRAADTVSATVLSSITTIDFPHLYALKEELRSIHFLHLVPEALRAPGPIMAPDLLTPDGRNLANVLARIERDTQSDISLRGAMTDIRNAISTLVSGVRDVRVRYDETERRNRIEFVTSGGLTFSARVASDGTLRMLALLAMIHDPLCPGVICFEEPENGVHKSRLLSLIEMLRTSCTDPCDDQAEGWEPLRQILLNTHSTVVAKALIPFKYDIMIAQTVTHIEDGRPELKTQIRHYQTDSQGTLPVSQGSRTLGEFEIEHLAEVDEALTT